LVKTIIINNLKKNKMTEINQQTNELAGRGSRLGAVIIDSIIIIPALIGIAMITGFWDEIFPRLANGIPLSLKENLIMFLVGQSVFLMLNGSFLANYGQTIGKKLMKIKIVDMEGNNLGLIKLYSLRYLSFSLFSQIPVAGGLISLLNILFVFGKERRCLHDRLAGTQVIKA
jgi:uncharacterized RDD family membrane protein YckC